MPRRSTRKRRSASTSASAPSSRPVRPRGRDVPPPLSYASSSRVRPERTEPGSAAVTSLPGRASASRSLINSQLSFRPPQAVRTSAKPPRSFRPCRTSFSDPFASPSSPVTPGAASQVPRSQTMTAPAPYLPLGDDPLERGVVQGVVLHLDSQAPLGRVEARPLGDGPAPEHPARFQAEIVVEVGRQVFLDHEDPFCRAGGLPFPGRFGGEREIPLGPVAVETHGVIPRGGRPGRRRRTTRPGSGGRTPGARSHLRPVRPRPPGRAHGSSPRPSGRRSSRR